MAIDLNPEQQRVIDFAVASGAYRSPGEVLDRAFEIIREQLSLEDWMLERREARLRCCAAGEKSAGGAIAAEPGKDERAARNARPQE